MPCESSTISVASCALRQLDQLGQRRQVALHAEDAVGDDQAAGAVGDLAELALERADVGVLVDGLAAGAGEADAVDDRGVVELVGEHPGALVAERVEQRLVRVPARRVGDRRLGAEELGQVPLELEVRGEEAADEADRGRPGAVAAQPLGRGLDDARLGGEAEVVVRAQADRLAPVGEADRAGPAGSRSRAASSSPPPRRARRARRGARGRASRSSARREHGVGRVADDRRAPRSSSAGGISQRGLQVERGGARVGEDAAAQRLGGDGVAELGVALARLGVADELDRQEAADRANLADPLGMPLRQLAERLAPTRLERRRRCRARPRARSASSVASAAATEPGSQDQVLPVERSSSRR